MAQEDVGLVLDEARESMEKAVRSLRSDLQKVRTGRASTALLDGIQVDYYGTATPLNQMANLTTPDPRLIVISPYDKSMIQPVEKAIQTSDLGLTPSNDGKVVRIPIPPLTEERRKELVKIAHQYSENAKVAVRHVRRDGMEAIKKAEKDGTIGKDDAHTLSDKVQKLTDDMVTSVDQTVAIKETEIMQV